MSIYGLQGGHPRSDSGTLADTSATAVLSATTLPNRACVVVGIKLVNHSGGNLTPVVDMYDGSTAFILRDNATLSDTAAETVELPGGFLALSEGDAIRVTGNANLSWHVSYIEPYSSTQG